MFPQKTQEQRKRETQRGKKREKKKREGQRQTETNRDKETTETLFFLETYRKTGLACTKARRADTFSRSCHCPVSGWTPSGNNVGFFLLDAFLLLLLLLLLLLMLMRIREIGGSN